MCKTATWARDGPVFVDRHARVSRGPSKVVFELGSIIPESVAGAGMPLTTRGGLKYVVVVQLLLLYCLLPGRFDSSECADDVPWPTNGCGGVVGGGDRKKRKSPDFSRPPPRFSHSARTGQPGPDIKRQIFFITPGSRANNISVFSRQAECQHAHSLHLLHSS